MMGKYVVTELNNGAPIEIIYGHDLTAAQRDTWDWLDWAAIERGEATGDEFFRDPRGGDFAGDVHYLGSFLRYDGVTAGLTGWDGYRPDSYWDALVVRYVNEDGSPSEGDLSYVIIGHAVYQD